MSKRDDLAHRIIDSLDRHGDSYGLVKGPSDLAYLVADDLLAAPSPALTREPENWDEFRKAQGWPTPNHMRRIADAIDEFTPAKYGDILRWVADACDDALSETPAPTSTREETP